MQIDVSALKSIFNPKLRPLIGVDISSTAVKMVELVDAGKGQPRVERYAIELLPKDAVVDGNLASLEGVADTLQRCWKRLGTSTRFVAMALPTAAVVNVLFKHMHLRYLKSRIYGQTETAPEDPARPDV